MKEKVQGQGLTEYALILSLVAVVVIVILALLGPAISNVYNQVVFALNASGGPSQVGPGGPADCYGSFLMPVMVGTAGTVMLVMHYFPPKKSNPEVNLT